MRTLGRTLRKERRAKKKSRTDCELSDSTIFVLMPTNPKLKIKTKAINQRHLFYFTPLVHYGNRDSFAWEKEAANSVDGNISGTCDDGRYTVYTQYNATRHDTIRQARHGTTRRRKESFCRGSGAALRPATEAISSRQRRDNGAAFADQVQEGLIQEGLIQVQAIHIFFFFCVDRAVDVNIRRPFRRHRL